MFTRPDLRPGEELVTNALDAFRAKGDTTSPRNVNEILADIAGDQSTPWDIRSLRIVRPARTLDTGEVLPGHAALLGRRRTPAAQG